MNNIKTIVESIINQKADHLNNNDYRQNVKELNNQNKNLVC